MNNKSKPSAFPAFGIRGAKVLPFLEMTKQNVTYFYPACKDFNLNQEWLYFPEKGCHLGTNRSDNET